MLFMPYEAGSSVGAGEVHAWLVDLDGEAARHDEELDARERDRAAGYLHPLDGARFAASRSALRRILARYVGGTPQSLNFQADPLGRPWMVGHDLQFSLARSAAVALIAISPGAVGADLERIDCRSGLADLAAARFGAGEAACIARGCAGSPVRGFYRHWTAKEAYLKATGRGLRGLREAELDCNGAAAIRFSGSPVGGWELSVIDVVGYAGAVAAGQPVTRWQWLQA